MNKLFTFLVLGLCSNTLMAQVGNNDCTNADLIVVDATNEFNTANATTSSTLVGTNLEPDSMYNDIWYYFVSDRDTAFSATTCESEFDTKLAIYRVSNCNEIIDFSELAFNDDDYDCIANAGNSTVQFNTIENNTYYIRVGGFHNAAFGPGVLSLSHAPYFAPAPNDSCQHAIALTLDTPELFDNSGATSDMIYAGFDSDVIYNNIWYTYSCTKDSSYKVTTCGSDFDTKLAIYAVDNCSSITDFSELSFNDDDFNCLSNDLNSTTRFIGEAGQTYYINVGGFSDDDTGAGQVEISYTDPIALTPNDSCHQAVTLAISTNLENCNPYTIQAYGATPSEDISPCWEEATSDIWFAINTGNYTSIYPRVSLDIFDEQISPAGAFFDFYTACGMMDVSLSAKCEDDTIAGLSPNTDYWLRMTHPKEWDEFDLNLCVIGIATTDIPEHAGIDFQLNPNPAKEKVYVQVPFSKTYSVSLTDIYGKSIYHKEQVGKDFEINIEAYQSGVYLMKIQSEDKKVTKRLVIE